MTAPGVVRRGTGFAGPGACLEDVIDPGVQGFVIHWRLRLLGDIEDLEGEAFLVMQQLDTLIGIDHNGDAFAA